MVARGEGGDAHLVAFVVTNASPSLDEVELHRYLDERLPRHMQPTAIACCQTSPGCHRGSQTGGGSPRSTGHAERGAALPGAEDPCRTALVHIWEELLEPGPIGITDNFFHLGGHSLLAGQLVYRIEQMFGTNLALSTLFAMPTMEQLAVAIGTTAV